MSCIDYYLFLDSNEFSSCTPFCNFISWILTKRMGEKYMGQDRRVDTDRRMERDRRLGNSRNVYVGPERRSIFDRRDYSERRYLKHTSSKIDLFQSAYYNPIIPN